MADIRERVKSLFGKTFDDEGIGRAVEVSMFNMIVEEAKQSKIPRFWNNLSFKRLYANKARSLLFNLGNPETPHLRADVLKTTDNVKAFSEAVNKLVRLTHREMNPSVWAAADEEVRRKAKRAKPKDVEQDHVGMFTCKKCKSTRTTYTELQTRSADEPSTLFVLCGDCQNRWKTSA